MHSLSNRVRDGLESHQRDVIACIGYTLDDKV